MTEEFKAELIEQGWWATRDEDGKLKAVAVIRQYLPPGRPAEPVLVTIRTLPREEASSDG